MDLMIILAIVITVILIVLIVSPFDLLPGLPFDDLLYAAVIVIMWSLIAMNEAVDIYNKLFSGQYGMLTGILAVIAVLFMAMMIFMGRRQ